MQFHLIIDVKGMLKARKYNSTQARTARAGKKGTALPNENFTFHRILL